MSINEFIHFSFPQLGLVVGCGLRLSLQQLRQVAARAHLKLLGDPSHRHRRLSPQLYRRCHFDFSRQRPVANVVVTVSAAGSSVRSHLPETESAQGARRSTLADRFRLIPRTPSVETGTRRGGSSEARPGSSQRRPGLNGRSVIPDGSSAVPESQRPIPNVCRRIPETRRSISNT